MINVTKLYCGLDGSSDGLRYQRPRENNRPIAVYNCTAMCNLKCIHCYSSSDVGGTAAELTTGQAKGLIEQLADYGCPVILFSGGEPLLRADIFELIGYVRANGIKAVLSTNGTLIDEETAARLAELGLDYAGISIDGPQDIHDVFRGVKGSFQATVKGMENCHRAGIKTGLRFTMTSRNIEGIESVFELAFGMGVRRLCFYHLLCTGRAAEHDEYVPSAEQVRNALDTIMEKSRESAAKGQVDEVLTVGNHADGPYLLLKMMHPKHPLAEQAKELLFAAGGNRTGRNIACVGWDGAVHADQFMRDYSLGNIKEKSFGPIWDNGKDTVLRMLRNKSLFRDRRCQACKWFDICGGNFRFSGKNPSIENWRNEPACYLTDEETGIKV